MADYLTARDAIATIIGAVAITSPVSTSINTVYKYRPDGGEGLMKYPNVLITGFAMQYSRFPSGLREREYTVGLRLSVQPTPGATSSMQDVLEAFKEAISQAFDVAITLDLITGGYRVISGPNWVNKEVQADGGRMWDEGEIIIGITDSNTYAA